MSLDLNRVSLFSAQQGRCAITGIEFELLSDIHCHHKTARANGGGDEYENLVLVLKPVHTLIHATNEETVELYLKLLNLKKDQLAKLNIVDYNGVLYESLINGNAYSPEAYPAGWKEYSK